MSDVSRETSIAPHSLADQVAGVRTLIAEGRDKLETVAGHEDPQSVSAALAGLDTLERLHAAFRQVKGFSPDINLVVMPDEQVDPEYEKDPLAIKLAAHDIPPHMHSGMLRYAYDHIRPGSFLSSVLSNQLREAYAWADDKNIHILHRYVEFMTDALPEQAWGSPEAVKEWCGS